MSLSALQGNNCCSSKEKVKTISALGMKHPINLATASSHLFCEAEIIRVSEVTSFVLFTLFLQVYCSEIYK